MKKQLGLFVTILSLAACSTTNKNEAVPTAVVADFNQEFDLNYRQQALLSTAMQPELTVEVTDIHYAFCPKNAYCFSADFVAPTLRIKDAQGNAQQIKMPVHSERVYTPNWIDTTSVRANNRRYVLHYTKWTTDQARDQPEKKDIAITLRLEVQ